MVRGFFTIGAALFLFSCTQSQPAQIVLKGNNSYTRGAQSSSVQSGGYSSYSSSQNSEKYRSSATYNNSYGNSYNSAYTSSVSENTEQRAETGSIGVSDLPPPSSSSNISAEESNNSYGLKSEKGSKVELKPMLNEWENKPQSINETKEIEPPSVYAKAETAVGKNNSELIWPVSGRKIIAAFGSKGGGKANDGIVISAKKGDPVWAAADGEVVFVDEMGGYGKMILIKHSGKRSTSYGHLGSIAVDKYKRVKQGDVVGYVGMSGDAKLPQLFFSFYKDKKPLDPQKYLGS